ncbi:MAG: hypothetical protein U0228_18420 [Myxococcaceae bacterium]
MKEVLFRVGWLAGRPAVAVPLGLLAVAGVAATFAPLLDAPGYELSEALCLLVTFVGPFVATAAARQGAQAVHAITLLFAAVFPALVVATLRTALGTPCDPFSNVAFVPLLLVPSVALVGALGPALAKLTRRRWALVLSWVALIALSAASTIGPLVFGPQVFAFNHFGGYLPGPLYDEELVVPASLLWFRAATLLLAAAIALWPRTRLLALVAGLGFAGLELRGTALGFRATDQSIADALGGVLEREGLLLHYPRGVTDEELNRMVGDLAFRLRQLEDFFGARPEGRVTVWWYRSAAEKQRLVGAAHTQFAKPWRREVHINGLAFPHPVIKHELVHALAAPWGSAPFGVAASLGGWNPHVGVIEGFAVAADNPIDDLGLHEWCAAMKKRGLLPDVASLMTPQGFYGAPHTRAYSTAGSFLRWLAEAYGKDRLRALYRHGDFDEAFGKSLPALAAEYSTFLDTVPLEPAAVNQAFARFRQGSLFDRPCAREVAELSSRAAALVSVDPVRAMAALQRCRALQPQEPSHALAEAQLLRKLGRRDDARAVLDAELKRLESDPSAWGDAALARADLAMEDGQDAVARTLWERLVELHVSPPLERTALVRLASLELTDGSRAAVQTLFGAGPEDSKTLALRDALDTDPRSIPLRYLLGRRLAQAGDPRRALPLLRGLLDEKLPPLVERETSRLVLETATAQGDCPEVERLTHATLGPAFAARAADWLERCRFMWPARAP